MNEISICLSATPAHIPFSVRPAPLQRVLVADADEDIRRLIVDALCCAGFETDSAGDGGAAWDALQTCAYDLLITDNVMPHLTGLELVKKMRAARMALPVIMACGAMPLAESNHSPWLRPAALLVKPYRLEELMQKVKTVLRSRVSSGTTCEPPSFINPGERPTLLSGGSPFTNRSPSIPGPFHLPRGPVRDETRWGENPMALHPIEH